jgi:hypothetical protein
MINRWKLTNSEAGWITAIFYGEYILAVKVLVTLTDRIDAKRVYFAGIPMTVFGHWFFAFFAHRLWTGDRTRARRHRMGWHLHDRAQASQPSGIGRPDYRQSGPQACGCLHRIKQRLGFRAAANTRGDAALLRVGAAGRREEAHGTE